MPSRNPFNTFIKNPKLTDEKLNQITEIKYHEYLTALNEQMKRNQFEIVKKIAEEKYADFDESIRQIIKEVVTEIQEKNIRKKSIEKKNENIQNMILNLPKGASKSNSNKSRNSNSGGNRNRGRKTRRRCR